jgi:hypothetical protein
MHDHQLGLSILAAVMGLNIQPRSASDLSDADLLAARISLFAIPKELLRGSSSDPPCLISSFGAP